MLQACLLLNCCPECVCQNWLRYTVPLSWALRLSLSSSVYKAKNLLQVSSTSAYLEDIFLLYCCLP